MKISKLERNLIIIAIIVIALISIYLYVLPKITNLFVKTYTIETGTVEVGTETEYLIIRDEKIYNASYSGNITGKIKEGELLRVGSLVLKVGGICVNSEKRGIVSYFYDGYEDDFTVSNMSNLSEDVIASINEKGATLIPMSSENVTVGNPIYKIVDNHAWYFIYWDTKANASSLNVKKKVIVRIDDTDIEMQVYMINEQGNKSQIILTCNDYYEDFSKLRVGTAKVITVKKTGLIVKNSSIVIEDGVEGVYRVDKYNNSSFVRINILASDDENSVVSSSYFQDSEGNTISTLKVYDTVLR